MMPYLYFGPHTILTYDLLNALALCAALICNLCFLERECALLKDCSPLLRKPKRTKEPLIFTMFFLLLLTAVHFVTETVFNAQWAKIMDTGSADYFGTAVWSPVVLFLLFMLLRVDPVKQLDLLTPAYAISLVFFKCACLLTGCCNGREWEHGLYFVHSQRYEFPSQLVELLLALAIFLVLIWAVRKNRFSGRLYPLYLVLYSATRFFSEFTREGEIVLWGLQLYQLQCIGGVVIGIIEWLLLTKYGERISRRFARETEPETQ